MTVEAAAQIKPVIKPGDTVKERYEVLRPLGEGGFGAVFEVCDKKTKRKYALKMELEAPKAEEAGLDLEVCVMKRIQSSKHAIRFVDNGKINNLSFVVMDLVGCNLADLRRACPYQYCTPGTALRLGLQCFDGVEDVHKSGLLHRDIKPSNFALGRTVDDCKIVYILDFGMVRRFRLKNGKIRPARQYCGFRGTGKYASLACHKGHDLGRVDDLWSWLYMFVELQRGGLPWRVESLKEKILPIKEQYTYTKLYEGMEPENQRIANRLLSLKYADRPQYDWYRQQIANMIGRKSVQDSDPYDWEPKGVYYKELKELFPIPTERLPKRKPSKKKSDEDSESEESESESTTTEKWT